MARLPGRVADPAQRESHPIERSTMPPILFAAPEEARYWVIFYITGGVIILFSLVLTVLFAKYFNLWIQSKTTGANVGLMDLVGMTFRKVNPNIIVRSKIM